MATAAMKAGLFASRSEFFTIVLVANACKNYREFLDQLDRAYTKLPIPEKGAAAATRFLSILGQAVTNLGPGKSRLAQEELQRMTAAVSLFWQTGA
jgi:hypothetical protein